MSGLRPSEETAVTNVGKKIKQLRELSGLSQEEMAAVTGFSSRTLRRWETGVGRVREPIVELVRTQLEARRTLTPHRPTEFSFVDLFAGIGGLRTGFEMAGGKCIFTSEWDKYAQQTYLANFGDTSDIAGDILQVAAESIPPHDILLAGFPCQPFSLAGVSKKNSLGIPHGFACDTQGTLFFEVARILKHHRPRAFMLENVKNLVSHDGGRTFRTIKNVLESDLGYTVFTKVIDAKRFVPQHRERILILGFREPNKFSWDGLELPPMENGPKLQSILHPEDGSEDPEAPYTTKDGKVSDRYYLSPHLWGYLQSYAAKHRAKGNGFGFSLVGPDDTARTLSARYHKDGSEILVKTDRETPRRLTPRECARLMGFDSGDRKFKIPVSDTQAYRQFGNSVVVPLIAAVARYMTSYLTRTTDAVQIPLAFDRISA